MYDLYLAKDEKHPAIIPKGHLPLFFTRYVHFSSKYPLVNMKFVVLRD